MSFSVRGYNKDIQREDLCFVKLIQSFICDRNIFLIIKRIIINMSKIHVIKFWHIALKIYVTGHCIHILHSIFLFDDIFAMLRVVINYNRMNTCQVRISIYMVFIKTHCLQSEWCRVIQDSSVIYKNMSFVWGIFGIDGHVFTYMLPLGIGYLKWGSFNW